MTNRLLVLNIRLYELSPKRLNGHANRILFRKLHKIAFTIRKGDDNE